MVGQFEAHIHEDLGGAKGAGAPEPPPSPKAMRGSVRVQAIDGAPNDKHPVIYETLLSAVALARFDPSDDRLLRPAAGPAPRLGDAARRGVDVG